MLSVSFERSERIQSDCKGCCLHPERVVARVRAMLATIQTGKELAESSLKTRFSDVSCFFSFFFSTLSLGLKCFPRLLRQCQWMYAFACFDVWACACACDFIEISGNAVGITRGLCSSAVLALVSVTLSCAIYKSWVSSSSCHTCVSILVVCLLFLGWHRALVVLVQSICHLLERIVLHIKIGEGVRQRCQRVQWVKGEKSQRRGARVVLLFLGYTDKSWLRVYRHIGAWSKINHFIVYQGKINNLPQLGPAGKIDPGKARL